MALMRDGLILASASPVRARLLRDAGIEFRVEPAQVDEAAVKRSFILTHRPAADCALALAELKAQRVSQRYPEALVIGADQLLVCGKEWFDKPADIDAARLQLLALRGKRHELVTAIAIVEGGERCWHKVSVARLAMRSFDDRFLECYLAAEGEALLGSVGGYRLEGRGIQLFTEIAGDHFAMLGLPLLELLGYLRARGLLS